MNNEIKFVSPFKRLCVTVGNLPTAYMESMSYYECLTYFMKFLENQVIPAINNNSEVVAELQEYVNNYFDNLNVQEEINNKLDEMAESGVLADIINEEIFTELNNQVETNTEDITNLQTDVNLMKNKKYIIIGDSYLQGYTPNGNIESWGTKLVNILGLNENQYTISYYGGSGFTRIDTKTFTQMINELTADNEVTDVIVCGGYNDGGTNEETLTTYMASFKNACISKFPNAKIHVGFIGWTSISSNIYALSLTAGLYKKVSAKLGLNYLSNVEYTLKDYFIVFSSDGVHPNSTGQQYLANNIASALIGNSANIQYDFKKITFVPASDYTVTSDGNLGSSVKNEITTIYCESPLIISKNTPTNIVCDNTIYEIGTINNGYVVGTNNGTVKLPITCICGISEGYDKVNGVLIINNNKIYLSFYDVSDDKTTFKTLENVYLIQVIASTTSIDSLMC